jgi:hypothetical protein
MKLEKLITLSQFVDKYCTQLANVRNYNNFLKQPLTKEMFVNPYEKPYVDNYKLDGVVTGTYQILLDKWQEAEKKVMFDCYKNSDFRGSNRVTFDSEDVYLDIEFDNFMCAISIINRDNERKEVKTYHDLAEATNGELTLKNVNI